GFLSSGKTITSPTSGRPHSTCSGAPGRRWIVCTGRRPRPAATGRTTGGGRSTTRGGWWWGNSRLALFRARGRVHLGEHAAALDDALTARAAARHERGLNPLLSTRREQWCIEQSAVGLTAAHLPDCDPAALAPFAGRLEVLPRLSPTLAEAVE